MKIVAAIIGMGIGEKHLEAINNYKNSKVKTICEFNKNKNIKLKKKYPKIKFTDNENDIFSDKEINLVSIASYDQFHYDQINKCFKNKKNIIVEKPICQNFLQLKKITKLIEKNPNIKITSNLVLRVNTLFKIFKKKLKLPNVFYIEADYIWGRRNKLFGWRSKSEGYSLIKGAGIHLIDLINWMTKQRPLTVSAFGNTINTKKSKFKKESFILMIFKFKNDLIVKITANGGAAYEHFHEVKIFSKNETFVNSRLGQFIHRKNKLLKINNSTYPDKDNRKKLIHNFIDNLKNNTYRHFVTTKDILDSMSICFAAEKSLKEKKEIKIRYLTK